MERAKKRAADSGFKFSNYIERLIDDDLRGTGHRDRSDCMVSLAEDYCPVYAADIRKACGDAEQPKILEMMLVAFAKDGSETSLSESFRTRVERAVSRGKPDSKRPPAPR